MTKVNLRRALCHDKNHPAGFRLAAIPLALALCGPVFAQTQPNAGTLLEPLRAKPVLPTHDATALPEAAPRPALKLDDTTKIAIKSIRITGASAFTEAELQSLVGDAPGKELTLALLNDVAQRITRHYRDAGYLLARAYLPAQDIKDGTIEIAVLEGRLGKLDVKNGSSLSDADIAARLAGISQNAALDGGALERQLLLLNDLPGVEVKSTLKPGASVGTTDLDIQVAARTPYAGSVELDNYGNRYTGDLRLGGNFTAGNLAGIGDTLSLRALTSEGMDYARAAWQAPVGSAGTQMGAAWSDMRYKLGKDFASLKAHGTATIASLYLLHPFQRSRIANINGQLNFDHKTLKDNVDATYSTVTHSEKTVDALTVGFSGDRIDGLAGGGMTNWSVSLTGGQLQLDPANAALDNAGHSTAGHYTKLNLAAARLQALADGFTLYGSVQAQQAGKNLDSSEKMSLGGAQAVRAYPQGEAASDDAILASLELRRALATDWQASLFYDVAEGRSNHSPLAADGNNHRHLSGAGIGLTWSAPGALFVQASIAWRDGPNATSDVERIPRFWVQAIQRF